VPETKGPIAEDEGYREAIRFANGLAPPSEL
jgi:hypothetical protein